VHSVQRARGLILPWETEFSVVFYLVRCVRDYDIRLVLTGQLTYGVKQCQVTDMSLT